MRIIEKAFIKQFRGFHNVDIDEISELILVCLCPDLERERMSRDRTLDALHPGSP